MKLGNMRRVAAAGVLSFAMLGSWMPAALADETTPAPADEMTPAPDASAEAIPETEAPQEGTASGMSRTMATTAAANCTITISSAPVKSRGADTNVWGSYSGCDDGLVEIQKLSSGSWSTIASFPAGTEGSSYVQDVTSATANAGTHTMRTKLNGTVSSSTTLKRLGAPTASSAGKADVGVNSNVWGTFPGAGGRTVWTEVYRGGVWARSQATTAKADGGYVLPLSYGINTAGTYRYRVASQYPDGNVVRSAEFSFVRVAAAQPPTINTAGTARIGTNANAWGSVPGAGSGVKVWTEVYRSGTWAKSREGVTASNGSYVLPLSYGMNTEGTYRYRVAAYVGGKTLRSNEVSFKRTNPLPAGIDRRCLTGRVLCASKTTNKMHWMIDGKILETVDVRYGRPGLETREGQFQVNWKSRNHVSSLYGSAMPFSMFFSGGQAVHYSSDFATRGWVGGSAGCINVRDWNTLERIYNQVRVGDKVVVYW